MMHGTGSSVGTLTGADVETLAAGAAVLGCGGGGEVDSLLSALRLRQLHLSVRLESVTSRQCRFAAVCFIGSTTVFREKPPGGFELSSAVAAVERWAQLSVDAVVPAQIGGLAALGAMLLADDRSLPLLDADLVGRATPRIDQLSIFARRHPPLTAAIVTSSGLTQLVDATSPQELEAALRGAVARTGGCAAFALGPLSLEMLHADLVLGSVSRALQIGQAVTADLPLACAARTLGGRIVARGRILDIERDDDPLSFVHGAVSVIDPDSGAVTRLEMGSEYLYVTVDGDPTASVPDVISVLDSRSCRPLSTDELRPGAEVDIVVLPAADLWRSDPVFLSHANPRFYGVHADPVAVTT